MLTQCGSILDSPGLGQYGPAGFGKAAGQPRWFRLRERRDR